MNTLWLPLLLSSVIWAEENYFHISPNATWDDYKFPEQNTTWDEARDHCQKCFKELTTITSRNVHLIVQENASLDYWIGLRRSYNGTIPWSRWSNGKPVTYQNWYPGHPVPNKVKKMIPRCFSTTETPLSTLITTTASTPVTSTQTSTVTTPETSTVTTPLTSPETSPITSTVTTLLTSPETSPETSPPNTTEDTCPILTEILDCLNITYNDLEDVVHNCTCVIPQPVTPKTTTDCTTPHATTFSTVFNTTTTGTTTESTTTERTTTERTTASNCIFEPKPDPDVYIEDACVVLLNYGMWKEVNCNESLPFICYDERFFGEISITNVTTRAGELSWSEAPGNITHYKVEITRNQTKEKLIWREAPGSITHSPVGITGNPTNQTFNNNKTRLYKHIEDLTPGNLYRVQVFPVKCGRDLNPQNISFYTIPPSVENLTVVSVTTNTVSLKWSKPEGDCDVYKVAVTNMWGQVEMIHECQSEECTITGLTPGKKYEFIVTATVNETTEGVPSSVSDYTIPSMVSDLRSADNESTVITAFWNLRSGEHSSYRYCLITVNNTDECTDCNFATNCIAENCSDATNRNITTNCSITENCSFSVDCNTTKNKFIREVNKTDGAKYCLCVAALTRGDTLSGKMVGIPAYTLPKNVSLFLFPDSQYIYTNWSIQRNYEKFNVMIKTAIDNKTLENTTTDNSNYTFKNLKAGVLYTVTVVTLNGNLRSYDTTMSAYTKPTKPGPAKAIAHDKTKITVTWGEPAESTGALILYKVDYHAPFWNDSDKANTNKTEYTFPNLKSGTSYNFNVRVVAGDAESPAVTAYADTEPEKRTLILTMLCSSETPLQCERNETQTELFKELKGKFKGKLQEDVYWKLKWVEKKVNNP